ncbi:glycosyltransferase family 2 protein [Lysobacter sp. GX 14042]|uniref:glycosyltransferase family A protein n=1 Tax=Lysobacter sp. GX 14042 TaxID=2907155 RepID=UPI001F2DCB55|nr:glycosyltransferase family A protein [Lysobacter sp. GX 14042]MCE7032242.1 glycosyltransferase family 2 protein [Lysobacter sp. GX 14042]
MDERGRARAGDAQRTTFDVVVPLRPGDHATIIHCLSALLQQTVKPQRLVLVDDGGARRDHALNLAHEFARANGVELTGIARRWSIGHVATLKRQSRESGADVLLVLSPCTVLESPDYLQACLDALDGTVAVASACGRAAVLWPARRRQLEHLAPFVRWAAGDVYRDPLAARGRLGRLQAWLAAAMLAHVARLGLEVSDRATMRACGGIALPAGGAVAYRRRYLQDLFDRVEPVRGDDLGAWPEQVIARAFATEGYRAVRVDGVTARMQPPPLSRLPRLAWSCMVGWLQAGYWFDPLLRSPLRAWRRIWPAGAGGHPHAAERRVIEDAFREPFGERITRLQGRPLGRWLLAWTVLAVAVPVLAWVLVLLGRWPSLGLLALGEAVVAGVLTDRVAAPGTRRAALLHAAVATPLRWGVALVAPVALLRVASGIWLDRRFRWRRPRPPGRSRGASARQG